MSRPTQDRRLWILRICGALLILVAAASAWFWTEKSEGASSTVVPLALLLPDEISEDDAQVVAWKYAAAEAGFPMQLIRASALLRPGGYPANGALIVPDGIHRRMNDVLIANLEARVRAGAALMLVQDAGVLDMAGNYDPQRSRFSDLVGVQYALYADLNGDMLTQKEALVEKSAVAALRLPPGKLMRERLKVPLTSAQASPSANEELSVVTYTYGRVKYPAFETSKDYSGQRLMYDRAGNLLAGIRTVGEGQVLFVNLPLSYLKLRTDGFFLNSFLRYFAQQVLALPQLAPVPNAEGALIMNLHIDSAKALPAIESMNKLGVFKQGPYSIHLTAGPDLDELGDGGGMDLANNPLMQKWVKRFVEDGDEVGSHGGWMHNGFGRTVDTQAVALSKEMIDQNIAAVEQASGRRVREYSAPLGNHPAWTTAWLRTRGINAYYFTGGIGMGPTRSFQDGVAGNEDMWAFPVLSYGLYASLEEAYMAKVPERDIGAWLNDVADYVATYRDIRLVYFHPPGIALYPSALKKWMEHTADLVNRNSLRWMTMAAYVEFSEKRLSANWSVSEDSTNGTQQLLRATHPDSLESLAWLLPVQRYAKPQLRDGSAEITQRGDNWVVVAGKGTLLELALPLQPQKPIGLIDEAL